MAHRRPEDELQGIDALGSGPVAVESSAGSKDNNFLSRAETRRGGMCNTAEGDVTMPLGCSVARLSSLLQFGVLVARPRDRRQRASSSLSLPWCRSSSTS